MLCIRPGLSAWSYAFKTRVLESRKINPDPNNDTERPAESTGRQNSRGPSFRPPAGTLRHEEDMQGQSRKQCQQEATAPTVGKGFSGGSTASISSEVNIASSSY
jgi:hypothetical protein